MIAGAVGIAATLAAALVPSCQPSCEPPPPADCSPPAGVPTDAGQVLVVSSSGSRADADLLINEGTGWQCARMDMSGRVGRNGVRPLSQRRSGDGTTPSGVFGIGTMTAPDGEVFQFFGNGDDPGVPGEWRDVEPGDCWGATPGTPVYNTLVTRTAAACTSPDEYLPNITGAYSAAALIDANMGPGRSGDEPGEPPLAAAIFLHRHLRHRRQQQVDRRLRLPERGRPDLRPHPDRPGRGLLRHPLIITLTRRRSGNRKGAHPSRRVAAPTSPDDHAGVSRHRWKGARP